MSPPFTPPASLVSLQSTFLALLAGLVIATPASSGILHRWSFSETSGQSLADSVGGVDGQIVVLGGAGHSLGGGQVTLDGGPRDTADYVQFPANPAGNLLDGIEDFTIELWATPHTFLSWCRVFSIGSGSGVDDSLWWSFNRSFVGKTNQQQFRFQPLSGVNGRLGTQANREYHYAVTWDNDAGLLGTGELRWYRDGGYAGHISTGAFTIADVNDNVLWLGRPERTGDDTANASWNEVRIYDEVLDIDMLAANIAAGPDDAAGVAPVANPDAVTVNVGAEVMIHVLTNDTGSTLSPTSVEVVSPPASGNAVLDGTGRIIYQHTGSGAQSDSFTYRVSNIFGTPSAVVTVDVTVTDAPRVGNPNFFLSGESPDLEIGGTNAFPGLMFGDPTCLRTPPGESQRLFVADKDGLLYVIPDVTAANPAKIVFLDLKALVDARVDEQFIPGDGGGLLGLAFHPDYANNREFFLFYTVDIDDGSGFLFYDRLSRFKVSENDPNAADLTSEETLFTQFDRGNSHNGGTMHFGPTDGYLYLSLGDEGGSFGALENDQRIDLDFFAAMLRIDVDLESEDYTAADGTGSDDSNLPPNPHPSIDLDANGNPRYEIPVDNPYIGATTFEGLPVDPAEVRTEFWAVGLRNPWQWWFDPGSGDLLLGDVGEAAREEVDIIRAGKNYGWAHFEGLNQLRQPPTGFEHEEPIYSYNHGSGGLRGNSVTGGVVYYGTDPETDIPELDGLYVFADYITGNVWSFDPADPSGTIQRVFGDTGIISFGYDPSNGDILYGDTSDNMVKRIAWVTAATFPPTLTATGVFANLSTLSPSPSLLAYEPNVAFWSDHAIKQRWFSVPSLTDTITFSEDGNWGFPAGTMWVKHFNLEMERGDPGTARRIETRILVSTEAGAYGVSYKWNDDETEAYLVEDAGRDVAFQIDTDPGPGESLTEQIYRLPSRAECNACHNAVSGHALSFNTRQLNQVATLAGIEQNQIKTLSETGYFDSPVTGINALPRFARADETDYSLEYRVRSYLAVNCAQCHQPGGGAPDTWDARPHITTESARLINGVLQNDGGDPANKVLVPGSEANSILLQRIMGASGFGRMPNLGSNELDPGAIQLVKDWINQDLPGRQLYRDWRVVYFGNDTSPEGEREFDADGDRVSNYHEFLTQTDPTMAVDRWDGASAVTGDEITFTYERIANRAFQVEVSTDLIDWERVDLPGNDPFFGAASGTEVLTAPFSLESAPCYYYRWSIKEP